MKTLTNSKKILFILIGLNVAVFAFYGLIYFKIKSNDKASTLYAVTAATDSAKDESLRAMKTSLSQNQDFFAQADSFFIPSDGVVDFINQLEALGKLAHVSLSVASVNVPDQMSTQNADFKQPLGLQIDTQGSWKNTYDFLSILENLPYVVQLNSVTFTLSSAAESILFNGGPEPRMAGTDEMWKGTFGLTVLKLK